jgi:antitoxin (DNA-binding transcriptional repressor) of toxin-antitoxin stability system
VAIDQAAPEHFLAACVLGVVGVVEDFHEVDGSKGAIITQKMVTRHGVEVAVLVPLQQWRHLQSAARPSLKELLLSDQARTDMVIPPRGRAKRRPVKPLL